MAQTSSAAREPSMEEILASIRRIIEDSDVVRQSVPPRPERVNVASGVAAGVTPLPVQGRSEIAEFRREPEPVLKPIQPSSNRDEAEDADDERRTQHAEEAMHALAARIGLRGSLDVGAETAHSPRVDDEVTARAGDSGSAPAGVQPRFDAGLAHVDAADDADDDYEPILDASNDDRQSAAARMTGLAQAAEDDAHGDEPAAMEPTDKSSDTVELPRASVAADGRAEAAREELMSNIAAAANPIISQATGRQVAAAFEDLSTVLRAEQRRSFDEMAEEMLRPMLQDWLDNNLPGLVERLVREEIERVVRAGRA
ncbi:DUF2497 domain-containing protein [Phyllobacterium salinisoli]|uniref:DUF2497 domain-containing protein n=1 Tax=Phyllobacterium salinisoli TaxID=1899321 RepID=A0A368K4B5_9HYPH|nr:DUF2497 domain-containing protein [Phyllobacterium salinisoli]